MYLPARLALGTRILALPQVKPWRFFRAGTNSAQVTMTCCRDWGKLGLRRASPVVALCCLSTHSSPRRTTEICAHCTGDGFTN
jgi:hypothetical protein